MKYWILFLFLLLSNGTASSAGAQATRLGTPSVPRGGQLADLRARLIISGWMLPIADDETNDVALFDADGDGDLDALVANAFDPNETLAVAKNRYLSNDGSGLFSEPQDHLPGRIGDCKRLTWGDVDADGDLDFIGAYTSSYFGYAGGLFLYLNCGKGSFEEAPPSMLDPDYDFSRALNVVLGDLDGDQDLDLVATVANTSEEEDRVYLNDGAGFFTFLPGRIPDDGETATDLALADLDEDGDLDLVRSNLGQNRLALNDGTGVFVDATGQLPARVEADQTIAVGDLDGDHHLDLIFGASGQTGLFLNDGTANFTDATGQLPTDTDYTFGVELVDVDADGDLDVVLARNVEDALYRNDGSGMFTDVSASLPAPADFSRALASGDVDADGDADLLVGMAMEQNLLYLNNGSGAFTDVTSADRLEDDDTDALLLADWDGDGDLDVFVGTHLGEPDRLLKNDGDAEFTDASEGLPAESDWTHDAVFFDVEGDGDLDLLLDGYSNGGLDRLLVNDGTGVFGDASTQLPGGSSYSLDFATGDIDGDGDQDFCSTAGLYRNDGSGTFADASADLPPGFSALYVLGVEFGDFDGDGDLDLYVGNGKTSELDAFYMNNAAGVFIDASDRIPPNAGATNNVLCLDVENDGDLDLVVEIGTDPVPEHLYLNDGAGAFADAPGRIPTFDGTAWNHVSVVDLDADGDQDLILGAYRDERLSQLLVNDGKGSFRIETWRLPADPDSATKVFAAGDLDGDEDPDIFIGVPHGAPHRIWRNVLRQVAWRALPRLGKPLTIDVYGPPGTSWLLASALQAATVPTAFGLLRLDPSTLDVVASGALGQRGLASTTWAIPDDPTLLGTTLFVQAAVGSPLRLSNLEVLELTDL